MKPDWRALLRQRGHQAALHATSIPRLHLVAKDKKLIQSTVATENMNTAKLMSVSLVARKLRETRLSIAAIQDTCGFKNANALKNLFKRRYKMSMRDYRAQHHNQGIAD